MSTSDPWEIEKYRKEQIEKDLMKRLGISIDIYGSPNNISSKNLGLEDIDCIIPDYSV